jgi:hypothetical protein
MNKLQVSWVGSGVGGGEGGRSNGGNRGQVEPLEVRDRLCAHYCIFTESFVSSSTSFRNLFT